MYLTWYCCFLVACPDRSYKYGLFHKKWVILHIFSRVVIKYTMAKNRLNTMNPISALCEEEKNKYDEYDKSTMHTMPGNAQSGREILSSLRGIFLYLTAS